MITKTFNCEVPLNAGGFGKESDRYKVHTWTAPGSDLINLRVEHSDGTFSDVETHSQKRYKRYGLESMVDYLFWLKR